MLQLAPVVIGAERRGVEGVAAAPAAERGSRGGRLRLRRSRPALVHHLRAACSTFDARTHRRIATSPAVGNDAMKVPGYMQNIKFP